MSLRSVMGEQVVELAAFIPLGVRAKVASGRLNDPERGQGCLLCRKNKYQLKRTEKSSSYAQRPTRPKLTGRLATHRRIRNLDKDQRANTDLRGEEKEKLAATADPETAEETFRLDEGSQSLNSALPTLNSALPTGLFAVG
ncbi:hypothetical protein CCM_08373 [Cordyceps militaris CM01]|uniref:Uncharacterized protein n=1 Tax=Cordyceps militaris (strain CM01) TaxID=983644 RepID=G3JR34_CORMM|nr:uncharacterized protein CCM_08373 [Cordyceps militaris CM01]EGX88330.1 hypothetical protein CCM_08373 [Cordyceps militaris CM01]